jgi:multicomponent K+:H+ antiporter subunit D
VIAGVDALMPHLVVGPVVLPLVCAAALLVMPESLHRTKALVSVASTMAGLLIAIALILWTHERDAAAIAVYLPSNWRAPFGIVLVADRLAALMLVLGGVVSTAAALFGTARWHRAGVHYHTLFQLQLVGVNGAFLTGDVFNLFVFFEVMLAASYGLLLHGSGRVRVRAGMQYIAYNLLASSLFLIGVALLYGVAGTLNFADIAQRMTQIPASDIGLLHAGAAILGIAFLAKAATWPLGFWLVPAYSAAAAPVAAVFVLLTKVGLYAVLRLWMLLSGQTAATTLFGADALIIAGLATLSFGAIGMLASQQLRRAAGFSLIVSSGTSLAAIGLGEPMLIGGALFYLVGATLASSALYLLAELIERSRDIEVAPAIRADPSDRLPFHLEKQESAADDVVHDALAGTPIPAATAFLGLAFVAAALMIAGLPPLAGFIAKFAMLDALLGPPVNAAIATAADPPGLMSWALAVLLLASGVLAMVGLSRVGIRHFWTPPGRPAPHLRLIEGVPVAALLIGCAVLAIRADSVLAYARAAAQEATQPLHYIDAVMSAKPTPPPRAGALPRASR